MLTIVPAPLPAARELILEYAHSLGVDLSFQHFEEEMAGLEQYYEAMFVARWDGEDAGCVALRRIDESTCEMKRLYVRSKYRGKRIGQSLVEHLFDEARRRGYERMLLDTLPSMREARALYASMGFVEVEPYRYNPIEGTSFMEKKLSADRLL